MKNLWLIILVSIILTCVGMKFPFNFTYLFKPGIVIPSGVITGSDRRFYDSFLIFIEKPKSKKLFVKVGPSNPKEVNTYLEKMERYLQEFEDKLFPEIISMDRILPVSSEGIDRILIIGSNKEYMGWGLFLYDTQYNLLHKSDFLGGGGQYVVNAKFTDRLWIQICTGGISASLYNYEILIIKDQIEIKNFESGMEDEYHTFKIINHRTNPRMVLYRKAYVPLLNWILYFLLFEALMLVLGLFLISRKH